MFEEEKKWENVNREPRAMCELDDERIATCIKEAKGGGNAEGKQRNT